MRTEIYKKLTKILQMKIYAALLVSFIYTRDKETYDKIHLHSILHCYTVYKVTKTKYPIFLAYFTCIFWIKAGKLFTFSFYRTVTWLNVSTLKKHSTSLVSEKVAAELIVFKNKCKLRHKIADFFSSSG